MTDKLDALFGDDNVVEEVVKVPITQIHPYKNHPYKINWSKVNELVESMRTLGQITPSLIRIDPEFSGDEIIAGHHRYEAAIILKWEYLNCIYRNDLSEEEIMLNLVDSNIQRSFLDLPHSERAIVIYEKHKVLSKQGIRLDIIDEIKKLEIEYSTEAYDSKKILEEEFELSPKEIQRYLRIYELIDPLKEALDKGVIPKRVAVDLSYAEDDSQEFIAKGILNKSFKIDMKKSDQIKKYAKAESLSEDIIIEILKGEEKVKVEKPNKKVNISNDIYAKYFNDKTKTEEVEEVIEKALELYYRENKKIYSVD